MTNQLKKNGFCCLFIAERKIKTEITILLEYYKTLDTEYFF